MLVKLGTHIFNLRYLVDIELRSTGVSEKGEVFFILNNPASSFLYYTGNKELSRLVHNYIWDCIKNALYHNDNYCEISESKLIIEVNKTLREQGSDLRI